MKHVQTHTAWKVSGSQFVATVVPCLFGPFAIWGIVDFFPFSDLFPTASVGTHIV